MRALRYSQYETPLTIEDMPLPDVGVDDVLIRTEAAALNPLDVKLHSGTMQWFFKLELPYIVGSDLAGTVERVGSGVRAFRPGDRVIGRRPPLLGGAFAEYVAVPQADCTLLPAGISVAEGAAIPTACGTAWAAVLDVAKLQAGQSILIHAAAGGVGSIAVQLAKRAGAHVIATASGDGLEIARSLGADRVIDYRREDFAQLLSGLDVVFDTVGGETQERSFAVLRPNGLLMSAVSQPDENKAKERDIRVARIYYKLVPGGLAVLVDEFVAMKVRILIDSRYPFERYAEAFERQASGRARGKIVVDMVKRAQP